MPPIKKKPAKAPRIKWKERAERAERVAKAAVEFEYCRHMSYQTYTSREAAERSTKAADKAFEELTWALRDTGMIKRD